MSNLTVEEGPSSLPYCFPPEPGFKKNFLTFFATTVLAAGILGSLYFVGGMTPLVQHVSLLSPLKALSWPQLALVLVSCVISTGVALGVLIFIHRKLHPTNFIFDNEIVQELDHLERDFELPEKPFPLIKKFLTSGYTSFLEYYGFYYQLSRVTKKVANDPEKAAQWKAFLGKIQGTHVWNKDKSKLRIVDSSVELDRLEGKKTEVCVEMLGAPNREDLKTIQQICMDAFDEWPQDENGNPQNYFFRENNATYVIRNALTREILGMICLEEKKKGKQLFIHTLGRKASAVDLGLSEKLKEHLASKIDVQKYTQGVECSVLTSNKPAQYIYKKLGFRHVSTTGVHMRMVYKPE
jgi:hypothetical protein